LINTFKQTQNANKKYHVFVSMSWRIACCIGFMTLFEKEQNIKTKIKLHYLKDISYK